MIVTYRGTKHQVISTYTWGSVEIAILRPLGYLHTITVPVCNLGSV